MNIPLYSSSFFRTCSREIIDIFPGLENKTNLKRCLFSDIIKAKSSMLGVYIVIVALITFTLFQGHLRVRNINCKLRVLDVFLCSLKILCQKHEQYEICYM